MQVFKKILKFTTLFLLLVLIGSSIYIYQSGPQLPADTDNIIETTLENPLPELINGETGFAQSQGINIWYESITPPDTTKGVVLLIMGISNDAMGWPPAFVQSFVDAGYQLIRYDHRGTGMSDWLTDWDANKPYTLSDMASDGVAILDKLGVSKAHIVGGSMGGMIAQEMATRHPERVASLASIMSSGHITDPDLAPISAAVAFDLIKVALKYGIIGGEKNLIKLNLASRIILRGNTSHTLPTREVSEQVLYNIRKRRGYNINASKQHQAAVMAGGSRYEELKTIEIPSLIIHGQSDPFIPIEHGKKCAALIPNADTLWIKNMGHDIPDELIGQVSEKIISVFKQGTE